MVSAALLVYSITAGTVGVAGLRTARWTHLTPRLGITAWQALATSVLLALAAAGLTIMVPVHHVETDLARLLDLCTETLRAGYALPGGTAAAPLGLTLLLALAGRTTWCTARTMLTDRRERVLRRDMVDLVAMRSVTPDALVVEHATPYAFCIGGRCRRVVLTTGLLEALTPTEVQAVLAHEDAHLRQRHHWALLRCSILFTTLAPLFPAFRRAMPDVRLLVELCADDSARSRVSSSDLRAALSTLASMPAPAGTLAASGVSVAARLSRLDHAPLRLGWAARTLVSAGIVLTLVIPLALLAAPALTLGWEGLCLLG